MKKAIMMAVLALSGLAVTGCVNTCDGFPSVYPGVVYSEYQAAAKVQDRVIPPNRNYTVVRKVGAQAKTTNVLGLVSIGDASYATLKKTALSGVAADDIINLEVDFAHKTVLGILTEVTTTIYGDAIKY